MVPFDVVTGGNRMLSKSGGVTNLSEIYSKYACVFTRMKKMPQMFDKAIFMQYKYLISANI